MRHDHDRTYTVKLRWKPIDWIEYKHICTYVSRDLIKYIKIEQNQNVLYFDLDVHD